MAESEKRSLGTKHQPIFRLMALRRLTSAASWLSIGDAVRDEMKAGVPALLTGYWIYHNRAGSVLFGTETREYFGILPAEIASGFSESVINCIACITFDAHPFGPAAGKPMPT